MNEQQMEVNRLRQQITEANDGLVQANNESYNTLQQAMNEERQKSTLERQQLLSQIGALITGSAEAQEKRVSEHLTTAAKRFKSSEDDHMNMQQTYEDGMASWTSRNQVLIESCMKSRENVKTKIKGDWSAANESTGRIKQTTEAIHRETVQIVDAQMSHMDTQLVALDEIIARVKAQNDQHHTAHTQSLTQLSSDVQESYFNIGNHMSTSYTRVQGLDSDMDVCTMAVNQTLPLLSSEGEIRTTLANLSNELRTSSLIEYAPTGQTPAKATYSYPTVLPRTDSHEVLLERMRSCSNPERSPRKSPAKGLVYTDVSATDLTPIPFAPSLSSIPPAPLVRSATVSSLRELDPNTVASVSAPVSAVGTPVESPADTGHVAKKINSGLSVPLSLGGEIKPPSKIRSRMTVTGVSEGRENLGVSGAAGGRRLRRGRGSD